MLKARSVVETGDDSLEGRPSAVCVERGSELDWWKSEESQADRTSDGRRERQIEQPRLVARCGFELVGVTLPAEKIRGNAEGAATDEASTPDGMVAALIAVLGPEHRLKFVYDGGGGTPLRWRLVAEARSVESGAQAKARMRNVQHALRALLESRRAQYRFQPITEREANRLATAGPRWTSRVRPRGTHVFQHHGRVGFETDSASQPESSTSVCLPHYLKERARAFSSLMTLLASSHVPLRIQVDLEPCRLDSAQEQALKAGLNTILDGGPASTFPEHLEASARIWLKTPEGCRITCTVSSVRPPAESILRLLGAEIYHGDVEVSAARRTGRSAGGAANGGTCGVGDARGTLLDLRDCIPAMAPLPALFPEPEALVRHGVRRFYNRRSPKLPQAGVLIGYVSDGGAEQPVRLSDHQRPQHQYILGATGVGKSTLLLNQVMQDIEQGEGVALIDPHGDLYHQVLAQIPAHRVDDVVLLDPGDRERAVGVNLLDCTGPHRDMQVAFVINSVLAILDKLYDMRTCGGPMFQSYFRGALELVMSDPDQPGTLVDMSAVFEHKAYRDALIKKCEGSLLADFWKMADNARGDPSLANIAPYIVSKLNLFVHNALLRPIIGQSKSTVDFRQIMDSRRILLVNLSRGGLGEIDTRLLGMVVLTKLLCAAMGRLDVPASRRTPYRIYVDEFQNFTADSSGALLSESRKYGCSLILANQNLAQLKTDHGPDNLIHSVLGNVGSMVLFRLGAPDAERLAIYTRPELGQADLQNLPNYHAAARLLMPQGPTVPFVFKTCPPVRRKRDAAVWKRIKQNRIQYTAPITEVEKGIRERREAIRALGAPNPSKKPAMTPPAAADPVAARASSMNTVASGTAA